jgi:hypothetical protein
MVKREKVTANLALLQVRRDPDLLCVHVTGIAQLSVSEYEPQDLLQTNVVAGTFTVQE